jgi:hypothetical protein
MRIEEMEAACASEKALSVEKLWEELAAASVVKKEMFDE